jgi:hypothetical protein
MTNRSGTACRHCNWSRGCLGCDLNPAPLDPHAILDLREIGTVAIDFDRAFLLKYYDPVAATAVCSSSAPSVVPATASSQVLAAAHPAPSPALPASVGSSAQPTSIPLRACLDEFIKAERLTAKCERCTAAAAAAAAAAASPQQTAAAASTPALAPGPATAGAPTPKPSAPQQPFTKQLSLWNCPRILIIQVCSDRLSPNYSGHLMFCALCCLW